jgi:uncharacterized RDD family membrane protein YckC
MNAITFYCANCGKKYRVDASRAGMTGRCKQCGGEVTVPAPSVEPGAPAPAPEPVQPPPPPPPAPAPAQAASDAPRSIGNCPYCREDMLTIDAIKACPACDTPHHQECWSENKGCTVFGCKMAPPDEEQVAVDAPMAPGSPGAMAAMAPPGMAAPAPPVYEKAKLGKRFSNYLIDYFAYMVVSFFVGVFLAVLCEATGLSLEGVLRFEFLINIAIFCGFYIFFEATFGRTPGKFATGTMVIREDGGEPTTKQILGRTLSRIVPFEPFSFFGESKTGWHDRWSGTMVVLVQPQTAPTPAPAAPPPTGQPIGA